ncbi:MAG TPA: lipocalin family protein [Candidatus Hydrogenedentes bacterium]|nr:lipocalin family protein [Candidatus Hydrogenedentota bacterium]
MKSTVRPLAISAIFTSLVVLGLTGCPATNPPETVASVDLDRYVGKWYEIARFPVIFQNGLVGVTAEYTLQDDGTVRVFNRGLKNSLDGEESSIEGVATVTDPVTNAKLRVRFDPFPVCLFPGKYWIVDLDENYQYAVVSEPRRKNLWILSRTPAMDAVVYNGIIARLEEQGFDTSKLELTPQATE